MDFEALQAIVEPPRGIFQARVDEKGRLKLPVEVWKYLVRLKADKVFVTSLDLRMIRVYPVPLWEANEKFFREFTEDPQAAEDIAFIANDVGADSDVDANARLLIPAELRRMLGVEGQPVWLDCLRGRINVYTKQVYEERKARALEGLADKLKLLESKGLR